MHNPAPEAENLNELTPVDDRVDDIESEEEEFVQTILVEETDCSLDCSDNSDEWAMESIEDEFSKPKRIKKVRSKEKKSDPVECAECGKKITTKRGLKDHIKIIHRKDPDERIICPECGLFFNTSTTLRTHMKWKHETTKNYQCEVCSKFFKTSGALLRHKNVSLIIAFIRLTLNRKPTSYIFYSVTMESSPSSVISVRSHFFKLRRGMFMSTRTTKWDTLAIVAVRHTPIGYHWGITWNVTAQEAMVPLNELHEEKEKERDRDTIALSLDALAHSPFARHSAFILKQLTTWSSKTSLRLVAFVWRNSKPLANRWATSGRTTVNLVVKFVN